MDHHDPAQDHRHADHGGQIQTLTEDGKPDQRDQHDPKARPQRIDHAHRHEGERLRQQVETDPVGHHHQNRGPGPRELLGGLQGRGANRLGHHGKEEEEIGHGGGPLGCEVILRCFPCYAR